MTHLLALLAASAIGGGSPHSEPPRRAILIVTVEGVAGHRRHPLHNVTISVRNTAGKLVAHTSRETSDGREIFDLKHTGIYRVTSALRPPYVSHARTCSTVTVRVPISSRFTTLTLDCSVSK
jgi:hypothetical protein